MPSLNAKEKKTEKKKGKVTNIEYGKIDFENDIIETAISNITSKKLSSTAVKSNLTSKTVTSTVKTGS